MMAQCTYLGHVFNIEYDPNDSTGIGSLTEIVRKNDYVFNKFVGHKDKVFMDIGANLGVATVVMAKLNPQSIVYAFEPYKKAYDMMLRNIELNSLTNVKTFNVAVSDKRTKMLKLSVLNVMSGANSTHANTDRFLDTFSADFNPAEIGYETVEGVSFDDVLTDNKIEEVYLLKIDCEGAEYDIIYNSELFQQKIVKNMVGEFHDLKYNVVRNNTKDLLEYCRTYVYGVIKVSELIN